MVYAKFLEAQLILEIQLKIKLEYARPINEFERYSERR
jgi:hypothetical protein